MSLSSGYTVTSATLNGNISVVLTASTSSISGIYVESRACSLSVQTVVEEMIEVNDDITTGYEINDTGERTYSTTEGGVTTTYEAANIGLSSNPNGGISDSDKSVEINFKIPSGKQFILGFVGSGNGSLKISIDYGNGTTYELNNFTKSVGANLYLFKNGSKPGPTGTLSYAVDSPFPSTENTISVHLWSVGGQKIDQRILLDIIFV